MRLSFAYSTLILGLLLTGCGNADRPATTQAAAGAAPALATPPPADSTVQEVDLSRSKRPLPLVMRVPKGSLSVSDDGEEADVTVVVNDGDFMYNVDRLDQKRPAATPRQLREMTTLAEMTKEWKATNFMDSSIVFKRAVLEQSAGFIYELSNDHFVPLRIITVGQQRYLCSVTLLNALPTEAAARRLYELMGQARAK